MESEPEIVRWYTRARRFPTLIGKMPDGAKIPFGPYTTTQVLGGAAAAIVMWQMKWLWTSDSTVRNSFIFVVAIAGAIFGLGKLPIAGRNPVNMASGVLRALLVPSSGLYRGSRVLVAKPQLVAPGVRCAQARVAASEPELIAGAPGPGESEVLVTLEATTPEARMPALAAAVPASGAPSGGLPLTGVQRLLAGVAGESR